MKYRSFFIPVVFFALLMPLWCAAVRPYTPVTADPVLEPWRWRQEEVLNGLGVLCMDEAADGTLWFGNTESIAQYDGRTVTTIPFDEALLSTITHVQAIPWAKALVALRDGNLLVLVGESVVLRANNEWKVILQNAGRSVFTARMEQAEDGTVWLIVPGALWRIDEDLVHASAVMEASGNNQLLSFCIDSSGDIWVVEKTGALTSRFVKIPVADGQPAARSEWSEFPIPFTDDKSEADLLAGANGLIWYTAKATGVELFDSRRGQWIQRESQIKSQRYYSLLKSRDGSIWAGGESKILRVSLGKDIIYPVEELMLPRLPMSLFETRDDRVWVIGRIGSVCSVDIGSREWITYKGLNYQCETPEGRRWFTSTMHRGVVSQTLNTGEWLQYDSSDGLIDSALAVIRSSQGLIWAVGSHEGRAAFSVFNGVRWERFCHPELLRRFEPNAVLEAADGTIWLGTGGDIAADTPSCGGAVQYKVNPDRSVELLSRHAPPDFPYYVTVMAQTADRVLWAGSTQVFRYDGTSPQALPAAVLQGTRSIAMGVDSNQTVWVVKDCFGVCRWRGGTWEVFGVNDGIPSLNLRGMCLLKDGSIMVSSDKGISRFNGKAWTANAYPEWFRMIQRKSGIKQAGDGSLWFNYADSEPQFARISNETDGFCTVRHLPETDPPETWIKECLKRVAPPGNSHITWSGHDLWSVTPVEKLQYSWRLDGGEWSIFSYETSRLFLALASGGHVLEVRARDRAFNIDPTPARIEFTVIAPVWRRPWFLILVSVLVGLILFLTWLLFRSRERYLLEKQAEHEEFLVKQQEEREKNLIERQAEREQHLLEQQRNLIERQREHEAFLVKQQEEREEHLKEVDRIKTGFFTNISHELRTPMTVISGRLETILRSELDDKHKVALSIVLRNAQRVLNLVTQLLDFRKIEEGKVKVEASQGDLIPSLRDWMASLQVLAESSAIICTLECLEECRGWFDFDKLQKIFTNLVANSIKYTVAGGEVRVYLNVEADACSTETAEDLSAGRLDGHESFPPSKNETTGRRLIFVVEDNGMGIAQEHLPHIFDRFYRVSEASMAAGAGIGLNLTRELVELLGGEIQVESPVYPDAKRPGTRFTVRLPVDGSAMSGDISEKPVCEDPSAVELTNRTDMSHRPNMSYSSDEDMPLILIVEDDEDVQEFIVDGLNLFYRVETAENGEIGLRKAKKLVPDLIVTDVMMPVMDGVTLCRELKTSLETSHVPVVMLTAKASLEHQIEGLKTGADDYVTKPFHMVLLQTRIANLLESRRLLREKFYREPLMRTPDIQENVLDKEFLEKAIHVLEENYMELDFNSNEFAQALNMSRSTLFRKLNAVANRSPSSFINEFRIIRAAELLKTTTKTVTEILFEVGFEEPTNFTRLFKKHFKTTPSKYRSAQRSS